MRVPPRPKSNGKKAHVTRYLKLSWPGHPLAHSDGKVYVHRAVLYEKIGPGAHVCHKCNRKLRWNGKGMARLNVDHLDGDRWNNLPDNLLPVCRWCNSKRSRNPNFLTHCDRGHEFTAGNTYTRRDNGGRCCRACARIRDSSRRQRRKQCPKS